MMDGSLSGEPIQPSTLDAGYSHDLSKVCSVRVALVVGTTFNNGGTLEQDTAMSAGVVGELCPDTCKP